MKELCVCDAGACVCGMDRSMQDDSEWFAYPPAQVYLQVNERDVWMVWQLWEGE